MLTGEQRDAIVQVFRAHGYNGEVRVAPVASDDERIFILPPVDYAALRDPLQLTERLQRALGRKTWVVPSSPDWPLSEPLS